ncbi:MAG: DUF4302 domain-containing protein [Capnocytophaga sp.]|nr:DUF4302 domain-containing protein [Capnocytophaga sp.]
MKYYIGILALVMSVLSCQKSTDAFDDSPSQRNKQNLENLRQELYTAPYGWQLLYFPKTDSLLFANKDAIFAGDYSFEGDFGYGGFSFLIKFSEQGTLQMQSDYTQESAVTQQSGEYEVRQNTLSQLSFTTTNDLHKLMNDQFTGVSDFLFVRKDFNGNLLFKSTRSLEPARDYILLKKLPNEIAFSGDATTANYTQKAYENRIFFEQIAEPQLTIKRGDRIYFKSDFSKRINTYRRYAMFAFKTNPDAYSNSSWRMNVLGSGYSGTEEGLSFHTGFRYNSTLIFYDFKRDGDKFVCELVRVYDKIRKRYEYMSKHQAEAYGYEYEDTYYSAEIQ